MMQELIKMLNTCLLLGIASPAVLASVCLPPNVVAPSNLINSSNIALEQTEHFSGSGEEPGYSVLIENKCTSGSNMTHMHFMVVNEEKRKAYNNGTNRNASITDHFLTAMAPDTSRSFEFPFARSVLGLESSWRLWWDTDIVEFSRNQTLIEVHCAAGQIGSGLQRCNIDVSNVDGLTSTVQVKFQDPSFPPITLEPPSDWQCPEPNRINHTKRSGVPDNYLPEWQACLSNCSLLNTKSACCPWPYTRDNCTNANPAFLIAAPETYTFAYDDDNVRCNGNSCSKPLRAYDFKQNSPIMHITTCFSSRTA
jgi:hypothetical protein